MAGYRELKLESRIAAWRSKLKRWPIIPPEQVEELAQRTPEEEYQRFFRDSVDHDKLSAALDRAEWHFSMSNIDEAEETIDTLERNYQFVWESVAFPLAIQSINKVEASTEQKRDAGSRSKRRWWADLLADRLKRNPDFKSAWSSIPGSYDPLEIELDECDIRIYRDGEHVYCDDAQTGRSIGSLKESSFKRRYFHKAS